MATKMSLKEVKKAVKKLPTIKKEKEMVTSKGASQTTASKTVKKTDAKTPTAASINSKASSAAKHQASSRTGTKSSAAVKKTCAAAHKATGTNRTAARVNSPNLTASLNVNNADNKLREIAVKEAETILYDLEAEVPDHLKEIVVARILDAFIMARCGENPSNSISKAMASSSEPCNKVTLLECVMKKLRGCGKGGVVKQFTEGMNSCVEVNDFNDDDMDEDKDEDEDKCKDQDEDKEKGKDNCKDKDKDKGKDKCKNKDKDKGKDKCKDKDKNKGKDKGKDKCKDKAKNKDKGKDKDMDEEMEEDDDEASESDCEETKPKPRCRRCCRCPCIR